MHDSALGRIKAVFFVSPDYLSVGTGQDWARVNITPMAAQKTGLQLGCFLPTRQMADDIKGRPALYWLLYPCMHFATARPPHPAHVPTNPGAQSQ